MNTITIIIIVSFILINILLLYFFFQENKKLKQENKGLQGEQANAQIQLELSQEKLSNSETSILALQGEKELLKNDIKKLQDELSEKNISFSRLEERFKYLEEEYKKACNEKEQVSDTLKNEFQEIMHRLLKERGESLEVNNNKTLAPLREELKLFKEQVEKSYIHEREQRTSLQNEIKNLMERSQELSQEAHQLAIALKGDSKEQGDWGEMILERILEQSGLTKGECYEVQTSIKDENGNNRRPDVIVRFPNNRAMIIDSKVSLSAYVDFSNSESKEEQERAIKRHLDSVYKHIDELATKNYKSLLGETPEFVLMFMPNEAAYNLAIHRDNNLWQRAYKKGVVLINATSLIAVLRLILDMWSQDKQVKNVTKIIERATRMYEKFVGVEESFTKLEDSLGKVQQEINTTKNRLFQGKGNLKKQMQELKEQSGLQPNKQLKNIDLIE